MTYNVTWHEKAVEDLRGVDKKTAKGIVERVKSYLSQNPLSPRQTFEGDLQRALPVSVWRLPNHLRHRSQRKNDSHPEGGEKKRSL